MVIFDTIKTLNKFIRFLQIALSKMKKQKATTKNIKGVKLEANILKMKSLCPKKLSRVSFKKQS